ncbi:hypothetical protein DT603_11145 [Pseudoxanthomonas gei]|uniref:VCBS repeat-containing protein n=1 Tax=Pseudoxanthomonas gei TaxID=1383030 RepID=A0ABX0AJJ3_9GAMM|nr:hypothetical protein [Pseudoxanthomonas gei]NDK39398.1 hypothetical protein [Pseudoxanthomonas gei]
MSMTTAWALLLAGTFAIQPPGQFHAGEAVARDGEPWLALRVHEKQAALVVTTLNVRVVRDELVDEEGAHTGLAISSPHDEGVIAYLRGGRLAAGTIEAVDLSGQQAGTGLPYQFTFHGQPYRLASQCDPQPRTVQEQQPQFDCRIELHTGGQRQLLARLGGYREPGSATMSLGDDASPTLRFAGDLDRDGKLDLIFDTTDHYNVSRPTLFLSSQAGRGELLHEVARYESVGC